MKNYLYLLIFLIISCSSRKETFSKKTTDSIVIIINNKDKIDTNIGSGINVKNFNKININSKKEVDTLVFKTEKYLKLYIRNDNFFNVVLCKKTDTLLIDIHKKLTKISFLNRDKRKYDTIPLNKIFTNNLQKQLPKHNKLFKKFISINKSTNKIVPKIDVIKSDLSEFKQLDASIEKIFETKKKILTKIFNNKLISDANYHSETSLLKYKYFSSLIRHYKLSLDKYYLEKISKLYFENNIAFNDPFISYGYLNSFVKEVILIENESKLNIDYEKAYKLLPLFFKDKKLKLFREFCLNKIAISKNNNTSIYFNNYKNQYNDSLFIKYFNDKYVINEKNNLRKLETLLINYNNKKTTLKELFLMYKNKIIYIDFWASWCIPCRNEMPISKKLQNEFNNEDIVFIYISIDLDKDKWRNAYTEEKINLKYNFLATNYPNSNFYLESNLKTIPRYLLYNKGKLINNNAPRPSSKKIKKILLNLLKK